MFPFRKLHKRIIHKKNVNHDLTCIVILTKSPKDNRNDKRQQIPKSFTHVHTSLFFFFLVKFFVWQCLKCLGSSVVLLGHHLSQYSTSLCKPGDSL